MRVLFVQQQPCIRTLKYAAALRAARPEIRLGFAYRGLSLTGWYGSGDELFDAGWALEGDTAADLGPAIWDFAPDVIHCHNLPDALTVAALELAGGRIPVIHDVHDLQSLRRTPYEDGFPEPADSQRFEKIAIEGSDALITVSDELLGEIRARYRLPSRTLVFCNYALRRDLPEVLPPAGASKGAGPRLVYQGTLSVNGGHYDLRAIFTAIGGQRVSLDIYPAREVPGYEELGNGYLRCRPKLPPHLLLRKLTGYDFGWAGFNTGLNRAHLDTALPNKAFEYVACGLPVLTMGHRALARLVSTEGLGVTLETLEALPEQLAALDAPALRRHIAAVRLNYTMEANIGRVCALYESVARS